MDVNNISIVVYPEGLTIFTLNMDIRHIL
jgi:hypothetical protein